MSEALACTDVDDLDKGVKLCTRGFGFQSRAAVAQYVHRTAGRLNAGPAAGERQQPLAMQGLKRPQNSGTSSAYSNCEADSEIAHLDA